MLEIQHKHRGSDFTSLKLATILHQAISQKNQGKIITLVLNRPSVFSQ